MDLCDYSIMRDDRKFINPPSIPNLDYKSDSLVNIDEENKKSITKSEGYVMSAFNIMSGIMDSIVEFENDVRSLYNDLNLRQVDRNFLERYNKCVLFFYNNILGSLNSPIIIGADDTIYPVKPVNESEEIYKHELQVGYVLPGPQFINKPLGEITNVSVTKVNDHVILLRGKYKYTFVIIDTEEEISTDSFRDHIVKYMDDLKELRGWTSNDLDFIKKSYTLLANIVSDIEVRTREIKFRKNVYLSKNHKKSKRYKHRSSSSSSTSQSTTNSLESSTNSCTDRRSSGSSGVCSSNSGEMVSHFSWSDLKQKINMNSCVLGERINANLNNVFN